VSCAPSRAVVVRILAVLCLCLLRFPSVSLCQTPPPSEPRPLLKQLVVKGATVFTAEDVSWLLDVREGTRLPHEPEHIAELLQRHYHREGYTAAEVRAAYDDSASRLVLEVDEGRIDAIEIYGVRPDTAERYRNALSLRPGDVFNRRIVRRDVTRVLGETNGSVRVGRPRRGRTPDVGDDIDLIHRNGQRVLVIPLREDNARFSLGTGADGREDLFSPVDGLSPALDLEGAMFDSDARNYTLFSGFASYKFAPERPGYSLGFERSFGSRVRWYGGVEVHDLTASDDRWRLSTVEQTLVALAFKNTFRDYYRRRGVQIHAALRAGRSHEILASWRRDRHEPLSNETNYSFFRDDHVFRENAAIVPADVRAVVLGYTFDSRGLDTASIGAAYRRHLVEDLFRSVTRQGFGWRVDWTGEIGRHEAFGEQAYQRHIVNARAYVPLGPRQSLSARLLLGESGGSLPSERRFALGGVGSVHGYRFKEAVGERMALVNLEYRISLNREVEWAPPHAGLAGLIFYDAGRVGRPLFESTSSWLSGRGVGLQAGTLRVELGFRAADIPGSRQILVRLNPTF
jgi:hypothetical protein